MLSKFSVKKPYTVIVGIIIVIVLGIVAATKMTTDLLPEMELPYAIIITTYPGASPETVEMGVTKPIESAVATINNVKEISSVSNENYSMVIIEFNGDTNMDTATIDMREKLDQTSSYFDDSVGSSTIMKLNPDMMPVMVIAADVEGMDSAELSRYIDEEIQPAIEAVDGVASVDTMGSIEESVQVVLNKDKLDDVNDKVKKALDKQFAEAEDAMDSASSQIESGKNAIESGKAELENQLAPTENTLTSTQTELAQTVDKLEAQLKSLEESEKALKELPEKKTALEAMKTGLQTALDSYNQCKAARDQLQPYIDSNTATEEMKAQYEQVVATMATIEANLKDQDGNSIPIDMVQTYIDQLTSAISQMDAALVDYDANIKAIEDGKTQINNALLNVINGRISVNEGLSQINQVKNSTNLTMLEASMKLENGSTTLDEKKSEFETAKDAAYDGADMNNIITADLIKNILSAQNFSMPAGYIVEDGVDYLVRVGNKFEDVEDMSDFVLLDLGMDGLDPIKLSDVADVAVVNNADASYAKVNGNDGIILAVTKQTEYSTKDVVDRLQDEIDNLTKGNDKLRITNLMDQGMYIDMVVSSVLSNLALGAILAIIILFLFLKDIKPTGIIAFSIPISVVFAIVLMYFSGVTLNVISLSGLALGVGMLVDNSIVVIENIYRLRSEGKSAKEAAITGAKQVAGAITASTLTTVSVFVPIIFTTGITKMLFVDMALTIAYSLFASLIIALTFVPMCAAKMFDNTSEKSNHLIEKVVNVYEKVLRWALGHRVVVIGVVVVALVASLIGAVLSGTSLMPSMDSTQISLTLTMPEGTTQLSDTAKMSDEVINSILEIEDIETVGAMVGGNSLMSMGGSDSVDTVSMYIICKEKKKHSNQEIADMIVGKTKDFGCEIAVQASTMDMSAMYASGVVINVKGKDLDKLQEIATDIAVKLEEVEGLTEISNGQDDLTPEYRIVVDKDKASEYGLTVAQVFSSIYGELADAKTATTLDTSTIDYPVYIEDGKNSELSIDDIKKLTIEGTKEKETVDVKISEIADIENGDGLSSINRVGQTRYISVTAAVDEYYNAGLVSKDIEKVLADLEVPDGYTVVYDGENEATMEAMGQVGLMLLLAVIFMYLIMVIQFQSFKSPFIIMFTVPLAFTGGFGALILTRNDVSVIAMIGMVMLAGIIVNNGIVLVDTINQLIDEGMDKIDAIITAGRTRLRPIVMTALTTILGLSTMAFGVGMGSDMAQPMAVVTIGGLIYGTILTLVVVPCIYDLMNRKTKRKKSNDSVIIEDIKGVE